MSQLNKAQLKASKQIKKRLSQFGIALLWGQIRSGKTRAFLDASDGFRVLVVTKKDSQAGILSEAKEIGVTVDVINYHSIGKKNPDDYDLIILDECHLYISTATPKFKPIWKEVVKFTRGKKLIFASGTPTPETYAGLYTMLALSTWSPFPFKRFTLFFAEYGIPSKTYTGTQEVPCYKKTQTEKLLSTIEHLVVRLTRVDTGHIHEAEDVLHHVSMNKKQKKILDKLDKHDIWEKGEIEIYTDTPVKALTKAHQIAGGVSVQAEPIGSLNPNWDGEDDNTEFLYKPMTYHFKKTPPKVKYIKENFDPETTMILSYYIDEQKYLAKLFPHTGSVTKLSTGVDLSHFKTMVIYSMGFSSANYEQVRGRMMNVKRTTPISVHYLISGIDEYVLEAVKKKENFTSRWYKKTKTTTRMDKTIEDISKWYRKHH